MYSKKLKKNNDEMIYNICSEAIIIALDMYM